VTQLYLLYQRQHWRLDKTISLRNQMSNKSIWTRQWKPPGIQQCQSTLIFYLYKLAVNLSDCTLAGSIWERAYCDVLHEWITERKADKEKTPQLQQINGRIRCKWWIIQCSLPSPPPLPTSRQHANPRKAGFGRLFSCQRAALPPATVF